MNSNQIKLSGNFEIPEALEIDRSYQIQLEVDIKSISKNSEEDGTYNFVFTAKPLKGDIIGVGEKNIKLKDKRKQSVKLRQQLGFLARDKGLDENEFYEVTMTKVRHHLLEILDYLESLN